MIRTLLIFSSLIAVILFSSCSRCSRSGNESRYSTKNERNRMSVKREVSSAKSSGTNVVRMSKHGGVYEVPAKINGVEMHFIFDTGASDVTISLTEALYLLKNGKLTEEDIVGVASYKIANGSIAEGTVINLRSVQIGNRKLKNVQASIVHNLDAPLLLGQSALEEFGEFSINYKKGTITFK